MNYKHYAKKALSTIFVVLMLSLLIPTVFSQGRILLNSNVLEPNTPLVITLNTGGLENIAVIIHSDTSQYQYLGAQSSITFIPQQEGRYGIDLKSNEQVIESSTFLVQSVKKIPEQKKQLITLSAKDYKINTPMLILLDSSLVQKNDIKLTITSENDQFMYIGFSNNITFIPRIFGYYTVQLFIDGALVEQQPFFVFGAVEETTNSKTTTSPLPTPQAATTPSATILSQSPSFKTEDAKSTQEFKTLQQKFPGINFKSATKRIPLRTAQSDPVQDRYDIELQDDTGNAVMVQGIKNLTNITRIKIVSQNEFPEQGVHFAGDAFGMEGSNIESATVRLKKTENVGNIIFCASFDYTTYTCPRWEPADISFIDYGAYVEFVVPHFTVYSLNFSKITPPSTNHTAWYGNWTTLDPANYIAGAEYEFSYSGTSKATANYSRIENLSDGLIALYSFRLPTAQYATFRFKFLIGPNSSSIKNITLYMNATGGLDTIFGDFNDLAVNLSIWNVTSRSWVNVLNYTLPHAGFGGAFIYNNFNYTFNSSSLVDYINTSDNSVYFKWQSQNTSLSAFPRFNSFVSVDYIRLDYDDTSAYNTPPNITTSPTLLPSSPTASSTLNCTFNATDNESTTLTYQYYWYNGTTMYLNRNYSGVPNTSLFTDNFTGPFKRGEIWNCTVIASDGTSTSNNLSSNVTILNAAPVTSSIAITPTIVTDPDNFTCYATTTDADSDTTTNIFNWYVNNVSQLLLNMPFDTNISGASLGAVRDYSPYANNGTLSGTVSGIWNTSCKMGGCFSFYKTTVINISKNSILNKTYNFTIDFWLRPNEVNANGYIFTNDLDGSGAVGEIYIVKLNAGLWILLYNATGQTVGGVTINNVFTANTWTHVTIVQYNGVNLSVFKNGTFLSTATGGNGGGPFMTASSPFSIGSWKNNPAWHGNNLNGTLDNFRIWNRSLSSSEVYQLWLEGNNSMFNSTIVGSETSIGENWTCQVIPNDVFSDGSQINTSILVQSTNYAPSVSTPYMLPSSPTVTTTTLNCSANASDSTQSTLQYNFYWYNNSVLFNNTNYTNVANNTNLTVNLTITAKKNDVWNCTVRAFDGALFSGNFSTTLTVINTAPVISAVNITPSTPDDNQNLTCYATTTDADSDTTTNIFNWYVNNVSQLLLNMPFDTNFSSSGIQYIKDYSPYNNSANATSSANSYLYWNATGKLGGSITLHDTATINISATATLRNLYNFTIEFWAKPLDVTASAKADYIFTNSPDGNVNAGEIFFYKSGPDLGLWLANSGGYCSSPNTISNVFNAGQWAHIALVVRSGKNVTVYKNGTYIGSMASVCQTGPFLSAANMYYVASFPADLLNTFNGTLDNFKIWNRSLTDAELYQIWLEGNNSMPNSTIVYQETNAYENWTCVATPNDATTDGTSVNNSVFITAVCPGTITVNTTLQSDLAPAATTCISFGANNLVLECNGYSIIGNQTVGAHAILSADRSNITIQNCFITNFTIAINITNTNYSNLRNINISNMTAISALGGTNGSSCTPGGNATPIYGIILYNSTYNNITNLTIDNITGSQGGTGGRIISGAANACLGGNGGDFYGIYLSNGSNNNFFQNTTLYRLKAGRGGDGGTALSGGGGNGGPGGLGGGMYTIFINHSDSFHNTFIGSAFASIIGGGGGNGGASLSFSGAGANSGAAYGLVLFSANNTFAGLVNNITGGAAGFSADTYDGNGSDAFGLYSNATNGNQTIENATFENITGGNGGNGLFNALDGNATGLYFANKYGQIQNVTIKKISKGATYLTAKAWGIYLVGPGTTDYLIVNSSISNTSTSDVFITSDASNNTLLNTTFNKSKVAFGACTSCNLTIQWYARVYVNDSGGNALPNVTINMTDINGRNKTYENTSINGLTSLFILTDMFMTPTGNQTLSNHTIQANKTFYFPQTLSVNVTASATYNLTIMPNAAPLVLTPYLYPPSPTVSTTQLNCSALATDSESALLTYEFYWYNGSTLYNNTNYTSVANNTNFTMNLSVALTKNQVWNCTVRAYDGTNYSNYNSSAVTVANTAPVEVTSRISPTPTATDSQDLLGYCNATDADGDTVTYVWQWYKNGAYYSNGTENGGTAMCYQESANVSTTCGGLSTGTYGFLSITNPANTYDGDLSTFGTGGLSSTFYVNYTKPSGATNTSLWQIKVNANGNRTISSMCWAQNPLQFRVDLDDVPSNTGFCYNGTQWEFLWTAFGAERVYEDAMWWNITNTTYHTQGYEINVANISNALTTSGDNWTLSCIAYDGTANSSWLNSTDTNIQNQMDLYTTANDILFSNSNPPENTNITINATIYNNGTSDASGLIVQFFDGDPQGGGTQIGTDRTINLLANTNQTVNMTWITSQGSHPIFVLIDPPYTTGTFGESNEINNKQNKTITISVWQIYYGKMNTLVVLDNSFNQSVYNWSETNTQGNVFVTDYDDTNGISFTTLQAIYRNTTNSTNTNTQNDFEDIDTLLNISGSNYSDNVNATFTTAGAPKQTSTWAVYNKNITTVSYINSTNTSAFTTGILWDTADSSNNYFDTSEKEDLVFVTRINMSQVGQYGTYDYEIKVPANLKTYKTGTNAVSFYYEIQ